MRAYIRRKRFEAKLMVAAVAESMNAKSTDRIPAAEMFARLGVTL